MKRNWDEWKLADDKYEAGLEQMCREAVDIVLDAAEFEFPAVYWPESDGRSGKAVKDPLTIYVDVNEGGSPPALKSTLGDILRGDIKACEIDGLGCDGLEAIAGGLDRLSRRLKRAVRKGRAAKIAEAERIQALNADLHHPAA